MLGFCLMCKSEKPLLVKPYLKINVGICNQCHEGHKINKVSISYKQDYSACILNLETEDGMHLIGIDPSNGGDLTAVASFKVIDEKLFLRDVFTLLDNDGEVKEYVAQ